MLIIEIAVGVFLGGMGLWVFVSYREKKKQAKYDEEQAKLAFNAAEKYITQRFKSITADYHEDIRRRLIAILDNPDSSPVDAFIAELQSNLSSEHFAQFKTQAAADAQEALKENFSIVDKLGARERLNRHIDQVIDSSCESLQNESGLLLCNEISGFNDDDLPSITQGHPRKQCSIGNALRLGKNVEQDYQKAVRLLSLSAAQGYVHAQEALGEMYYQGEGVTQDYHEALKWFRLAADQESAFAQNYLGLMYANGYGVKQDYEEALKWHHLSAAQGFAAARVNIGVMYFSGEGVEQSYVLASMWFILAAANGDVDALNNLGVARKSMSPEQITEAEIWALYKDKDVLHFLLRLSEGFLSDPLSIYRDPVPLAEYFTESYLTPIATTYKEFTLPILLEIEQSSINDSELIRCTEECVLWAAAGVAGTVKYSKSADYYSAFVLALADRVSTLLSWQDRVGAPDEIKTFLEDYIDAMENKRIVEFANAYGERYVFGNANESANLWDRAFALCMATMKASKGFFGACMAEEKKDEIMHNSSNETKAQ